VKIDNLRQLKALLKLCRSQGVNIIKISGMEIVLEGHIPTKGIKPQAISDILPEVSGAFDPGPITPIDMPDAPSEDQLMFGSSDPTVWTEKQ